MIKKIILFLLLCMPVMSYAGSQWFRAKVLEVSIRNANGVEVLYILLEGNPNPANCGNSFAGAEWAATGKSMQMAAAVALTAKTTGQYVRASIDTTQCGSISWPQMNWITLQ